jgi:hypothetical protein
MGRTAICGRAGASARTGPRLSSGFSPAFGGKGCTVVKRTRDRLQRTEEAIVVATGAPRERGCPPWVVLGVKALEARSIRAA